MTLKSKASLLLLPYSRLAIPGWGPLLRMAGVFDNAVWDGAPVRTIRAKDSGYLMPLNLTDWSERLTYFLGCFHETATRSFLNAILAPGDTYLDVGGNIGLTAMPAASKVGPTGRVHIFEPNPVLVTRLRELIRLNQLTHVTLHPTALSDAPGELTLTILHSHHGMGTLGEIPDKDKADISERHTVPVSVGDSILPADLPGPATIKLDVEGFELHALRGMQKLLERLKPALFTEVSHDYLQRAGASTAELFAYLHSLGYEGYNLLSTRDALRRHRMQLSRVMDENGVRADNVVWLIDGGIHFDRLKKWMA